MMSRCLCRVDLSLLASSAGWIDALLTIMDFAYAEMSSVLRSLSYLVLSISPCGLSHTGALALVLDSLSLDSSLSMRSFL